MSSHFTERGHICYGDWTQSNGTWNNYARACKGDGGAPIFHAQTKVNDRPEKCKDLFQDPPDPKCEQYHRVSFLNQSYIYGFPVFCNDNTTFCNSAHQVSFVKLWPFLCGH